MTQIAHNLEEVKRRIAAAAQRAGRDTWYADYTVRIARVERAYGKS